ncbi:MAG: hypothetical protein WA977_08590 [Halobacteriota archaeon]
MTEVCEFCGSTVDVVDGVCSICVRGWDYRLEAELQAEFDALECPVAQARVESEC